MLHYFSKPDKRKSKRPPQFAKQGMLVQALFTAAAPICIEKFNDYKTLGRFTLRDEGKTVAIGRVVKVLDKDNLDMDKLDIKA